MLVRDYMCKNPVTVTGHDTLVTAHEKMLDGRFRHLPVVRDGHVIGILSDRDVRSHTGTEARTRVETAMTKDPITISPLSTVEEAARLLLRRQISALPIVQEGRLAGIITTNDVLHAFLDLTGAAVEDSVRLDVVQANGGVNMSDAVMLMHERAVDVLGVGVYQDPERARSVFYLRLYKADAEAAAAALRNKGYTVLGVHP